MVFIIHNLRMLLDFTCFNWCAICFFAGFGILAQHRCKISWQSQIIQLSSGQSLGAKNNGLWAPVI